MFRRTFILAMILLAASSTWNSTAWASDAPFGNKHVLVIGIDGARSDSVQAAKVPNLRKLIAEGTVCWRAFSGGHIGTPTEQRLVSGPSWASILTGVWVDKHHVLKNYFEDANLKEYVDGKKVGYPPFFTRIKEKCPDAYQASIVNWNRINEHLVFDVDLKDKGNDLEVAQKCAALLAGDKNPTAIFLQFDEVDGAGHRHSYGPDSPGYMAAIEKVDGEIGIVIDAMRKRPNFDNEDWLVLVTADHGGLGTKHGNQTPEERTVFIIATGGKYPQGKLIEDEWGIVALVPTVFEHLGIEIDPAWGLESPPFE